jgi:ABC-type sugar transport system ATPase subunit
MLLEMTDIRKSFAGSTVLHGVSFKLAKGEIHALVGHNGAGKSTLMKVLGGLYADHGGTIAIAGKTVALATPREAHEHGVATIYQDFALVPDFTVAENIALGRCGSARCAKRRPSASNCPWIRRCASLALPRNN